MRIRDFKKLLKEKDIKEILSMHLTCEIFLTDFQLGKILKLNDGRGSALFKYDKKGIELKQEK